MLPAVGRIRTKQTSKGEYRNEKDISSLFFGYRHYQGRSPEVGKGKRQAGDKQNKICAYGFKILIFKPFGL